MWIYFRFFIYGFIFIALPTLPTLVNLKDLSIFSEATYIASKFGIMGGVSAVASLVAFKILYSFYSELVKV